MPEARLEDPPSPADAPDSSGLLSRIAARLPRRREESPPEDSPPEHLTSDPAGQMLRWPADRPHPVLVEVGKKGLIGRLTGLTRIPKRRGASKEEPSTPAEPSTDFTTFRREPGGAITLVWPPRPLTDPAQAESGEPAAELPPTEPPTGPEPVGEDAGPVQPAAEKPAPAERTARKRRVRSSTPKPAHPRQTAEPRPASDTVELPAQDTPGVAALNTEPVAGTDAADRADETVAGSAALAPDPALAAEEEQTEVEQVQAPDRTAAYDPIPDRIGEPLRGMLVREQQVLHQLENAFGSDDPGVLNSRSNLAYYLVSAGEYARAVLVQEQVASETARVLGDKHPYTLTARTRLAQWRKLAKKHRRSRTSVSA